MNLRATFLLGLGLLAGTGLAHPAAGATPALPDEVVLTQAAGRVAPPVVTVAAPCETDGETLAGAAAGGNVRPYTPPASPAWTISRAWAFAPAMTGIPSPGRLPEWATTLPPPTSH